MNRDEFEAKYKTHPLGITIKACEDETSLAKLHRYFIAAKTAIAVLQYQGELSEEDAEALRQHVDKVTDGKLGKQTACH